jgi:uncharacterized protein DUF4242
VVAHYVVELYLPGIADGELDALTARAKAAAAELTRAGTSVRFLRSLFLPEDETYFCVYEAPSQEAAIEASRRAELAFDRVLEARELV